MSKRKIIKINEELCNGCQACLPNCPEGALQMIDGKARLVSDLFCDGLGACIGHCAQGAITIEEREAEPYDERQVMARIVKQGKNTILAHLNHLHGHGAEEYYKEAMDFLRENGWEKIAAQQERATKAGYDHNHVCPGSLARDLSQSATPDESEPAVSGRRPARLRNWPVQLHLAPVQAPFFQNADLLIAADCCGFAYPELHDDYLKNRVLLIGCPKLDDTETYQEKLSKIFSVNSIRSVTVLHMEVPCCFGLAELVRTALVQSGKKITLETIIIGIDGTTKGPSRKEQLLSRSRA